MKSCGEHVCSGGASVVDCGFRWTFIYVDSFLFEISRSRDEGFEILPFRNSIIVSCISGDTAPLFILEVPFHPIAGRRHPIFDNDVWAIGPHSYFVKPNTLVLLFNIILNSGDLRAYFSYSTIFPLY